MLCVLVCLSISFNLPYASVQAIQHSASNRRSGAFIQLQEKVQAQAQLSHHQSHVEGSDADADAISISSAITTATTRPSSSGYTITKSDASTWCIKYSGNVAYSVACCLAPSSSISLQSVCQTLGYNRLTVSSTSTLSNNICAKYTNTEQTYNINLNQYCIDKGYNQAYIIGTGQASIPKTVWSWVCRGNLGSGSSSTTKKPDYRLTNIDFNSICQTINGVTGRPSYSDFNDPLSWRCLVAATFQSINAINIAPYCYNISTPLCGGQGHAQVVVNTWNCSGQRTVDFTQICTGKGMKYDASQANKGIFKCV